MGVNTFTYPTNRELMAIEQKQLPTLTASNPIFSIFPEVSKDTHLLEWEQLDNYQGMQQVRGLNGKPPRVNPIGQKKFRMSPGVYGEHMTVDEEEMTVRRQFASTGAPIDVSDLVVQRGNQLLHRQLKRQAWIGWQLLVNGVFSVTDLKGAVLHADSYTQRIYTAPVPWGTLATAAPLFDLRQLKPLQRGFAISFGRASTAYANSGTVTNLLLNNNPADLGGKRIAGGSTFNSLPEVNAIMNQNDLPQIAEWDGTWEDEAGGVNLDIPNNTVVVKGVRVDGAAIGNWVNTRCAVNPGMAPGKYYEVFEPFQAIPPTVEVHRGQNGGIALYFPSAVVVMKV